MTDKEIVEQFMQIPKERREMLLFEHERKRQTIRQNMIREYIRMMAEILGEDLNMNSRKVEQVNARAILSYVMHERNFTESEIGRALCKDHSMIHYYIGQTQFYLDEGFHNSRIRMMQEFKLKLKEHDIHRGTI